MASSQSIIIQNPKIRITDFPLYTAIMSNHLDYIKKYCNGGIDIEKLKEVMTLGINPDNLHVDDRGITALLLAAKNKLYEMLEFIFFNAMQDESCRELLANQLLVKVNTGRNILHEASSTPNNKLIINMICQIAKELAMDNKFYNKLENYINLPDDMYGYTALHLAASRSCYENYLNLVINGADEKIVSKYQLRAIDVYAKDYERSKTFKLSYLTSEGAPETIHFIGIEDFKRRHATSPTKLSADTLNVLIEIDLDILHKNNGQAQAMASCKTMGMIIEIINKDEVDQAELNAFLGNLSCINFTAITAKNIEPNKVSGLLLDAVNKGENIKDYIAKNLFIRAEVLRRIKSIVHHDIINVAFNKEALDCYAHGSLIMHCPNLALDGIKLLDLNNINPLLVIKRVAVHCAQITLNMIPEKRAFIEFFDKSCPFAKKKIQDFINALPHKSLEEASLKEFIINFNPEKNEILINFKQSLIDNLIELKQLDKEITLKMTHN